MGAGQTGMANRNDRRIEPSFDGPRNDAEDDVFSVREEDRVVPSRRKQPAKRKSSKGRAPERGRSRSRKPKRGLFGIFGRLVYWCFVLAIWGGIAAAGIVVY
jgi:penicillin-binding protein 1A